jgi:hypothetical protein
MEIAHLSRFAVHRPLRGRSRPTQRGAAVAGSGARATAASASAARGGAPLDAPRRPWSGHRIDLRASIPLPRGSWYVTIVAGPERRNVERLRTEGQLNWLRRMLAYGIIGSLVLASALIVACLAVIVLYLLKSAIGINLFEDSSPLHFIYEMLFESRARL